VLKAFTDKGFRCYGVDIAAGRIENARKLFEKEISENKISFFAGNMYEMREFQTIQGQIDLIVLKDTIEHIVDQAKMMRSLHTYLKPDGAVFVGFPPWRNPFGGHQQLADSFLRYVPWFHILPKSAYHKILQICAEPDMRQKVLLEIYDTRLSIHKFEKLLHLTGWKILRRQFYLFNPIYEYKFGIKGKKQFKLITRLPFIRDFVSTGVYYLVS